MSCMQKSMQYGQKLINRIQHSCHFQQTMTNTKCVTAKYSIQKHKHNIQPAHIQNIEH